MATTTTTTDVMSYDFTLDVPEFDSALLMELLEEADHPELLLLQTEEDDMLLQCFVGQSPSETHEAAFVGHDDQCEECGLDNILPSKLDSRGCSMMAIEDPFDSMEMQWYMDGGNLVGEYEEDDQSDCFDFYCGQATMEQVYIPLWQ